MNNCLKKILGMLLIFGLNSTLSAQIVKKLEVGSTAIDMGSLLDFVFKDSLDRKVRLSDYKGKFLFVDLWYSGCGGCITANEGLSVVHEKLRDSNVVFFSISVDKNRDKWLASITPGAKPTKLNPWAGRYVPYKGTIVLYTDGTGYENDFIRKMVPRNVYPKLLMFGADGKLIDETPPRPDYDPGSLVRFILSKMEL